MFDLQRFEDSNTDITPAFGLLSKADKKKIDSLETTYAKKAEAIVNCVETDDGYALINGNGDTVFTIPFGKKASPQLTITPSQSLNIDQDTGLGRTLTTATISRFGNGTVYILDNDITENCSDLSFSLDDLTLKLNTDGSRDDLNGGKTFHCTVAVAETYDYQSETAVFTAKVYRHRGNEPTVSESA